MQEPALDELKIRAAQPGDASAIWRIYREVVDEGTTFMHDQSVTEQDVLPVWLSPPAAAYVAVDGEEILGAYVLKPNQPGRGAHIANAAYMVARAARGRGLGRRMGEHSLVAARELGYRAMQFNGVVSTNEAAVRLWQSLGFTTIGTVPEAFAHPTEGLVAVHIMHRFL